MTFLAQHTVATKAAWVDNCSQATPTFEPCLQLWVWPGIGRTPECNVYGCNGEIQFSCSSSHQFLSTNLPAAPQITAGPSNSDLGPGDRVFLNCEVAGIPRPQIVWYKTDVQGRRSELPIVGDTFTVHTQRLELHDVARDDTGTYECQAGNVLGASSQRATVRVEGECITWSTN